MRLRQFFVQRKGKGILELVASGDYDSALLFRGKPVSFNWNDMGGSVLQYLTRYQDKNWDKEIAEYRDYVGSFGGKGDFAKGLRILLDLFSNGYYLLEYIQYEKPGYIPLFISFAIDKGQCRKFYPEEGINTYLLSRSEESFDKDTIERYKRLIIDGERPYIISAQPLNSEIRYVVDGNHKAKAYEQVRRREGQSIVFSILNIVRLDPPEIKLEKGLEYISVNTAAHDNYKKNKPRYVNIRLG